MFIQSIKISNLLSFGPDTDAMPLSPLNILIGANGSGKSNFLEVISLLQAAPKELNKPIRDAGGLSAWLWKGGQKNRVASVEVLVDGIGTRMPLRHRISMLESAHRIEINQEVIENWKSFGKYSQRSLCYNFEHGRAYIRYANETNLRELKRETIHPEQSILSQRKDIDNFPAVTRLGEAYSKIKLFREWGFGRFTVPRGFQDVAARNDFLEEDFSNLGMVINQLRGTASSKNALLTHLQLLNADIDDFDVQIEGGRVQVFFHEKNMKIPATRLSDGTLRYLSLLTILCHPNPPPLVCIEEPELGLHPDIIPTIAKLLLEASSRMQLIVTTHSDILIDAFTEQPESVIVCDKVAMQTVMRRLSQADLAAWIDQYRLGTAWLNGNVGGVRW